MSSAERPLIGAFLAADVCVCCITFFLHACADSDAIRAVFGVKQEAVQVDIPAALVKAGLGGLVPEQCWPPTAAVSGWASPYVCA